VNLRGLGSDRIVVTTREDVIEVLRSLGEHDRATEAGCCLPKYVDTARDARRLHEFGLSEQVLRDGLA
jgi:hypothetical protein